ncbi:class I SAM-dependent methyltransferase [Vermiphilus pyriformis]|nr:MAG: class I SAM-dependent methyltransferase [Vermiphilus pyriformis]
MRTSNRWATYYEKKLQEPPRAYVVNALALLPNTKDKTALDIGCGIGHETLLLLEKGYKVTALDGEQIAIDSMLKRPEIKKYKPMLTTMVSQFQRLAFEKLPQFDVIVASFSLPFCPPQHFEYVFSQLLHKLKPKGYFIGTFFDPSFNVFHNKDRQRMTFHTREQVKRLFENLTIIQLDQEISMAACGKKTEHIYHITAINNR